MYSTKLLTNPSKLIRNAGICARISLFILIFLSACGPAELAAAPLPVQNTPSEAKEPPNEVLPTPTIEVPTATSAPKEDTLYPYYLPLAAKPDVAQQTLNGVTAKIDWAYADEARIAVQYTLSGLDWPDGTSIDPMQQMQMTSEQIPDLWMGAVGWNNFPVEQGMITGSMDQRLVEGTLEQEQHPNIRLNVDIPVEGPTSVGTFHFKLDLPVLPGTVIENIDQTVEANNVAMTLKGLRMTPSYVEALICFQMPSPADWGLTASRLAIGNNEYSYSSGGLMPGVDSKNFRLTDPERCSSIGFDIVHDESAASLTLTVPVLMGSVPEVIDQERVDRANQRLAEQGIEFEYANVDHGGSMEVIKRPEGKTDEEIYPLIWEALVDQYEGPWVFSVPIER